MTILPDTWSIARVEQITSKVGSGATPRGGGESYQLTGTPLIRSMNVVMFGFKREGLAYLDERQAEALRNVEVQPGDVLLNITGASIGRVTLAPADLQGARVNQHVCIIRPTDGIDARYLAAYLSSPAMQAEIGAEHYGMTRQALTKQQILDFEIPIPPALEQTRIADKLDALIGRITMCRERLGRVPQILKKFREAVLEAAVSGRLTEEWRHSHGVGGDDVVTFEGIDGEAFHGYVFPASWQRSRLSEIAQIVGGITKDSKKQEVPGEELPYLRVANVQRGFFSLAEIKTIRIPHDRIDSLLLRPGDILLNEGGDIDKLGRGWVWEGQIERCSFQNHVFRARLSDRRFAPKFFSHFANSRGFEYFLARGKQTTNLASINKSVLSSLPVPIPPIDEQAEIVRRVDELLALADGLRRRHDAALTRVEQLTPSILAKAFRGELVPQDPNDEPAAEMLERLKDSSQILKSDAARGLADRTGRRARPRSIRRSTRRTVALQ